MSKTKTITKHEIWKMAKELGIKRTEKVNVAKPKYVNRNKTKDTLIREIQAAEDNIVCYKTDTMCNNTECLWYTDCQIKPSKRKMRNENKQSNEKNRTA